MLPPDSTATVGLIPLVPSTAGLAAAGSSSRWYSQAATAAAPPGSATSRACRASSRTAASISASVTVTMPATSARICANGSAPICSTRSASATVRWTSAAGQATRSPRRRESRASAASSGSTPTTAASGQQARTAAAIPEIRPPPLTGTRTRPTCGQSAAISRPTVPWPAMTSGSSNGGISTYPCRATSSEVAAVRAARVGSTRTSSAP